MNVSVILPAAGLGTRLRPITNTIPKCLVPINGVPLLELWLRECERARVEAVLVNTHYLAERVAEFAAARRDGSGRASRSELPVRIADHPSGTKKIHGQTPPITIGTKNHGPHPCSVEEKYRWTCSWMKKKLRKPGFRDSISANHGTTIAA